MPKSLSKTPAPKKDRIFGSDKNKKGSSSSKESAKDIQLNDSIIETLTNKATEYNESHPKNKVSVATLKAVMRRGMGAYSTSHRPTITGGAPNSRQAWGFARVNKFLKKKAGEQVKAAYVQDDDLMADGGETKKSKDAYTLVGVYESTNELGREESEDLTKEGLIGYRLRYNKAPKEYYGYATYGNTESDLETAKRFLERYNQGAAAEKERKRLKDIENKIKREKQKIIDAQKLEAAKSDDSAKPAYLMTISEYQDRVVPLLKEYEKFARKNSEYLSDTSYSGFYKVTFEQVVSRGLEGKKTGYYFRRDNEKELIEDWNERKLRKYDDQTIPKPTPKDVLEKNISFFNDLNKFFDEKVIFDGLKSEYKKSNKPEIRRAIEDDTYKKLLENGEITEEQVIKIAEEHGIKVPKRVFSQESNLKKEAKKQMDEILSKIPKMNKDVFDSLYNQLFKDFEDVEKIVFEREKERYEGLIKECIELSKKEGGINEDKLQSSISFWKLIFKESKSIAIYGKDSRGYPTSQYFQKNLELKSDYKPVMDKIILDYAESLKYRFLKSVLENFPKVSKPITNIEKKKIDLGVKGFEGRYRFNFADGSYFDFVTEAIPAAGYNIVAFHYRYITHLENATLADGTKVKGYYEIMQNFSSDSMADGGEVALLKVGQILHLRRLPMFKRSGDLGKQREVNKKVVEVISKESWIDEDEANQNNKHKTSYFFKADDNKKYSATFWGNDLISVSNDKVRYEAINDKLSNGGTIDTFKKVKETHLGIDQSFENVEYKYKEATIYYNNVDKLWVLTMQKNGKPQKTIGGYKTLKIAQEVGLYYLNNPNLYADGGQTGQAITCVNCGWHWNTADSDESDKYICHKCGFDNRTFYDPEPIGVMADGGVIEKGQLIEYNHSGGASAEAKFLSKVGENKAKIEILNNYTPYTKRVLTTEYVNPAGRTEPANFLKEVPRGTIKIVSVNLIEPITEKSFRHRAKPISKWLKSTEFKEAFGHLDNPTATMADGGALGVPSTENLIELVRKERENKIREWNRLGFRVVVARNDGYSYEKESERDTEFIDAKNPSERKVADIIKNNPDVLEIGFNGTIKVGKRVGEELEIADDFSVVLWKKDDSFFKEGLKFEFVQDGGKYINTIVNKKDTITYKDRQDDGKYVYFKQLDVKYNTESESRSKKDILKEEFDNNEAIFIKDKYADGGQTAEELFKPSKTIEQIAKEKDVPLDYAEEQLRKGMKTESEHSDNPMVQETIALQHLDEMIDYYEKLEYIENQNKMAQGDLLNKSLFNKALIYKSIKPIREANEIMERLDYMESQNKMANGGVTKFYKEYLDWYIDGVYDKMTIMVSVPNALSKMSGGDNDLILDVFEKKDESVNAKEKMKELLEIVDRNGLDVYLEPIPRLYNIKDKSKREKITREYLIKYYENFGFELLPNGFMVRKNNKMEKGGSTTDETYQEQQRRLLELSDNVYRAKKNIANAEDVDEAIQKFYDARNEYNSYEQSILDKEDNERRDRNIDTRIADEKEDKEKYGEYYEYKELFKKSPALAALQSAKDMIEYVKSQEYIDTLIQEGLNTEKIQERQNQRIKSYEQDVKDLEYYIGSKNQNQKNGIWWFLKSGGEINPDNKSVKDYFSHGSGNVGGVLVGKRHSEGGIKAVNKSTNQPLEMEGGEVVITRNAVSDNTKREFNGEMLTNREILSKINESGGGVSFADGGDIPETISTSGKEYKYGGKMMKDHEIVSSCGCNHSMAEGGR